MPFFSPLRPVFFCAREEEKYIFAEKTVHEQSISAWSTDAKLCEAECKRNHKETLKARIGRVG